jgi:hypothetical protein
MNRVTHLLFGEGVLIEPPRITESGKSVCLVRFDASETDRLILADSLKPTDSPAPGGLSDVPKRRGRKNAAAVASVKKTRRRKAKPISEEIPDTLLVEDLDESLPPRSESLLEEYEEA